MQQQIELKAVLPNKASFDKVVASFGGNNLPTNDVEQQDNHFYDSFEGVHGEAGSFSFNGRLHDRGASLRLRVVRVGGVVCSAGLTLKDHCVYEDGSVSRWATRNAPLNVDQTNALLESTISVGQLLEDAVVNNVNSPVGEVATAVLGVLARCDTPNVAQLSHLTHVGSFHTARMVLNWSNATSQTGGLLTNLDHTTFSNGTERFELEVPNIQVPVQDVLEELSQVLRDELGIPFELGTESKYQVFLRTLPKAGQAASHLSNDLKLVFPSKSAYEQVCASFTPEQVLGSVKQLSHFFDTPDAALSNRYNTVFRIRQDTTEGGASETLATLKEQQAVSDGQNFCWSQEHQFPAELLQAMVAGGDPSIALQYVTFPVVGTLVDKLGVTALRYVGNISNVRRNFRWSNSKSQPNLVVRLDHTTFSNGTERFELEVPNIQVPVQDVLEELSQVLRDELGIPFELGTESKYQVFLRNVSN